MKSLADQLSVELTCPACSHKIQKTLAWLQKQNSLICPGCGQPISIEKDTSFQSALRELKRLDAGLGKLFK